MNIKKYLKPPPRKQIITKTHQKTWFSSWKYLFKVIMKFSIYLKFPRVHVRTIQKTNNWNLKQGNYRNDPCLMRKTLPNSPQQLPCLNLPLAHLEIPSSSHSENRDSTPGVVLQRVHSEGWNDGMEWIGRR